MLIAFIGARKHQLRSWRRSLQLQGLLSHGRRDHLAVNHFNLRNSLHNIGSIIFLALITVAGVTYKEDVLDFGELSDLGDLFEGFDLVVAHEKDRELHAGLKTVQLFNLIV